MKRAQTIVNDLTKLGFNYVFVPSAGTGYSALVCVSNENGDDSIDYYGECRGGYPWVNPKIEEYAKANGLEIQWENPGCIGLYRI